MGIKSVIGTPFNSQNSQRKSNKQLLVSQWLVWEGHQSLHIPSRSHTKYEMMPSILKNTAHKEYIKKQDNWVKRSYNSLIQNRHSGQKKLTKR